MEEDYAHMKRLGRILGFSFVLCLLATMVASGQPAATGSDRIMISVTDADVQDVIHMLMKGYQVPVAMSGDVQGRVTLHMTDAPIEQVLNAICELSALEWRKSGGVYLIKPKSASAPTAIVETTSADSADVVTVAPTTAVGPGPTIAPSFAPVPPPEPRRAVTRSIKLKYASARDTAFLFGAASSPQNPAWFFREDMFVPAPGDSSIRYGPYFERTSAYGRPDNAYYIAPLGERNQWSAPGSMQWLGPGSMMYPQLPPPPPPVPTTPTAPGTTPTQPTAPGAPGGGALSALLPTGIDVLAAIEWLNLLIVRGDEESIAELERIIREVLDVKPKQVTIEAQFLEISTKEAKALGIDWSFVSNEVTIGTVGMMPAGNLAVSYSHGDFAATLSALEDSSTGQVINAPKVTTMNNFPATLVIEEDYPYFRTTYISSGESAWFPTRTVEMVPVTTGLSIVPRINEDDSITTLIQPQVSDVIKLVSDPEYGEVPQISTRSLTTMLRVNDGETIVMGGLVTRKASTAVTRVPILSKIPILGPLLFTRRTTSLDDTQLLIFLTPRVLHEEEELVPTPGALPGA